MERDRANREFPEAQTDLNIPPAGDDGQFEMWHDVFVEQELPWRRFLQSVLLHTTAAVLIWAASLSWLKQQKILNSVFDRSSLVTYTPQEYLPRLDTGATEAPKTKGDPAYAKQPILSVPREADNRSQTIVTPPDLKLNRDVPLPNIVATGAVAPEVPLEATRASSGRVIAPETAIVAPAPEVQFARERVVQSAMKTDVIAPPPDLQSTKGHVGPINIASSEVVAPAPQLTIEEQHTLTSRSKGLPGGGAQPVGPPPSMAGASAGGGRLVALGIHPVVPTGPVAVPAGNRRGTFAANPQGKPGGSGVPDSAGSKSDSKSFRARNGSAGSLPSGLHVGAEDAGGSGRSSSAGGTRVASALPDDKITDEDRKVFGGKRVYGRTLNMPNLNSSTGSWVMKFAELDGGKKDGELLEPVAMQKSDPGYPLELIRSNVHGMVTLYAVIHSDGRVGEIRVLNSPDDRLDSYAAKALARWKFLPAERAGKPVSLEAVVEIPFRVRQNF
jgi:TonB family protein